MYKQASRMGLKFPTPKGLLTLEQLWSLSVKDLTESIKGVSKTLNADTSDDLAFLQEVKPVDSTNQLRFDILKDVFLTKQKEAQEALKAKEDKEWNQKVLAQMAALQEGALQTKSYEELQKMLR